MNRVERVRRFIPPPEIWNGSAASPASDLYALGATYFFILTGRLPYEANGVSELADSTLTR